MRLALTVASSVLLGACSLFSARPAVIETGATPPPGVAPSPVPAGSAAPATAQQGAAIASAASTLVGTPYHFGGADEAGFDCSGLALYVHERVGLAIPRTAADQQRAAHPVPLEQILPGDLVFFRMRKRGIDHVGIYTGAGHFVHAPHAGVAVSSAQLSDGYYARHIVSAGRFWEPAASAP
jgi:murein DD-endopeptidase